MKKNHDVVAAFIESRVGTNTTETTRRALQVYFVTWLIGSSLRARLCHL